MECVLNVYKPQGMTPLQAIDAVREMYPEYRDEKMTYAGRLDPMAEGVLIVLIGAAVHTKDNYLQLDKVYETDIVFGFGTDTHDLLGMPTAHEGKICDKEIKAEVANIKGVFEYPFPMYSSKPVNGKSLFQWAREERLNEIEIPKRTMHVYDVELLDRYEVAGKELQQNICGSIARVQGDFRQEEIVKGWKEILADTKSEFLVVRVRVHCASGTYIRTLANELGKRLGTDAVLMRLMRTRVGDYVIEDSLKLD